MRGKRQAHDLSTIPPLAALCHTPTCVSPCPAVHPLDPPHHSSPFLPMYPHRRHPLHVPAFGTLPGMFPYPSPALGAADPRHSDVPAFGASSLPDDGTDHTILIDTRAQPFYTRAQNSSWFHSLRASLRTPPGGCPFPTTAAFNGKGDVDDGRSSLCSCLETQPGLKNV
jgi:hypothetical protein